jgi:uncharacterized protein YxeA
MLLAECDGNNGNNSDYFKSAEVFLTGLDSFTDVVKNEVNESKVDNNSDSSNNTGYNKGNEDYHESIGEQTSWKLEIPERLHPWNTYMFLSTWC